MLFGQRNKEGGCLCAWRGTEQTLKRMEWLQAGALGPQEAPPPPWQGRLRQYSTGRAAEALPDSHRLSNLKVSSFYCKWEAQGIFKKTKGWSSDSRSRIFLLLGRLLSLCMQYGFRLSLYHVFLGKLWPNWDLGAAGPQKIKSTEHWGRQEAQHQDSPQRTFPQVTFSGT